MVSNGNDCVISYNFENKQTDGPEWADGILVTNNLDIIEIVDIFEFKD